MSKEAVRDLLKKADADPTLRRALQDCLGKGDEAVAAFLEKAVEQGCEFTVQEFVDVVGASTAAQGGSLSDDELEQVAGGLSFYSAPTLQLASSSLRLFSSYSGPSIRTLGGSLVMEEEEEIQT